MNFILVCVSFCAVPVVQLADRANVIINVVMRKK
jgi:hypothetical protein